jgi:acetyl esterase/lipase
MLRQGLIGALLLLTATMAGAADKAPAPNLGQIVSFPGGVAVHRDLVYAQIEGFRPLTLDLYQPPIKPKQTPRPAIVFVHGGGWVSGDARHLDGFDDLPGLLAGLAAKNYVVASVNYRLASEAHFPGPVQDVKAAIRWLRSHAADYNIDTTRVMIWGAEAGGQIAALVGTSCGVAPLEPAADAQSKVTLVSDCVQGVIDWYGPMDLASWTPENAASGTTRLGAHLGCEAADCAPGIVRAASPISYISALTPPFLIQHGSADTRVPPDQSQTLNTALQSQHVPSEILVYPGLGADFTRDGNPDADARTKALSDVEAFITRTFPVAEVQAAKPKSKPAAKAKPSRATGKNRK